MKREEIYNKCLNFINKNPSLLLELPTGFGKTRFSIDIINHLVTTKYQGKPVSLLLLVAKIVHKQTWKEEIEKWGGLNVSTMTVECYESLRKHVGETYDIVLMDEVHHVKSEARLEQLSTLHFTYMLGLSATIPRTLKAYLKRTYSAWNVKCDLTEAIEEEVLPEPQILLLPLKLDIKNPTETIELNPKAKGQIHHAEFKEYWKYKKNKQHAIIHCTQKQRILQLNSDILWSKGQFIRSGKKAFEFMWLQQCGERLKLLSDYKIPIVKEILKKLKRHRTITFCKTIEQSRLLGRHCIHSQNKKAEITYEKFNEKKINHITAVNILNENANLVDCKYAIFTNLSSSDTVTYQRLGRSLRHKSPVIIIPYYENTREHEIVNKIVEGFNKDYIKIINSISEI